MVRAISTVEEEFEKSEQKRQQAESQAQRKKQGQPVSESEAFLKALENIDVGSEFKHFAGLVDFSKLAAESVKEQSLQAFQLREQAAQIVTLQNELGSLRTELSNLRYELTNLINRIGQNPELEHEVLTNLNRYLKNWL
jgi:hypothetical protein